jgi:cobaltochelatase CobN
VDVTVRLSGIVRDCFAECVDLVDEVVQAVALLPEPEEWNAVRANVRERLGQEPEDASPEALRQESFRLFGSKAGTFGSGVNLAVYASAWEKEEDLSDVFLQWNGFAYGKGTHGLEATAALAKSLETVEVTFANTASDESDLFSCCCYFSVHGGMVAATKSLSGREPRHLYGDTRDPSRVHVGTLAEEITRVTRATLLNPVWIEGQKRHGYRGAAEIAKRAVRVYGWQATTGAVEPWVFDELTQRYVLDDENREFFQDQNPWALEELGRRMLEAEARGLWEADPQVLENLRDRYQEVEGWLEEDMGDAGGGHQGGSVDIVRPSEVPAWAQQMKRVHSAVEGMGARS